MLVRRRKAWRSVVFNVFNLLLLTFAFCSSSSAETKKPSCAACLSTGRAIERALSKNTGGEDSRHQQQQMQRRRGRSFPAFASEPAVAAALAVATCEEVRFFSLSALSLSRALPLLLFHREEKRLLQRERKTLNKNTGPAEAPPVLPLAPRGPLCGAGRLFTQRSFFVFVALAPTPAAAPSLRGGALRPPERSLQAP